MSEPHPLFRLNEQFSSALSQLEDRESQSEEAPRLLYHYTTAEGLLGIVESGRIFASHILYQNDRSELVSAVKIFEEEFESSKMAGLDRNLKYIMGRLIPSMVADASIFAYFVVSFCEDGNLLSQWRAYGGSGSGYSLGFDTRVLGKAPLGLDLGIRARKVVYEDAEKHSRLRNRLEILSSIIGEHSDLLERTWEVDTQTALSFWKQALITLQPSLALMKDVAFSEEREWRLVRKALVTQAKNGIKVRLTSGRLTPYVPVPWSVQRDGRAAGLEVVICGPSDEPKLKVEATQIFLASNGWANVNVTESGTPLRHP
jgi:hypothetical protein